MADGTLYGLIERAVEHVGPTISRALAAGVVLDTWMNGQAEEHITPEAVAVLDAAAASWAERARAARVVFPSYPMPQPYVEAIFDDLLTGTALYVAQQATGTRTVSAAHAGTAVRRLAAFTAAEPEGMLAVVRYHAVISGHEDLNAIAYYGRMRREDFLWGTLHRPWSDRLLTPEYTFYSQAGIIRTLSDGDGEWVTLTPVGQALLERLRGALEAAGEFAWRANAQRWVIFGETDYDRVYNAVFPDSARDTKAYLDSLPLPPGARVLEVGAGTGRATFDLGLADRVAAAGGELTALEPSAALLETLRTKRAARHADHVTLVQGVVEAIPFPADSFDLVVAVAVLHFTDVEQAAAEMVRVARPGGLITARTPNPVDPLQIPMVAAWFGPLRQLAERLGVPLGERKGLPPELVEAAFRRAGVTDFRQQRVPWRGSAADPDAFLAFVLKGGAFYQNILARLPIEERWALLELLGRQGRELAAHTRPEEQEAMASSTYIFARKPLGPED